MDQPGIYDVMTDKVIRDRKALIDYVVRSAARFAAWSETRKDATAQQGRDVSDQAAAFLRQVRRGDELLQLNFRWFVGDVWRARGLK